MTKTETNESVVDSSKKVKDEENLVVVLKMVLNEINDGMCNASRRRIFLTFLESVNWTEIEM